MAELFLQLTVSFFMTPFIIASIGDRLYGFWILAGTLLGYYGLLELGLGTAVSRYVARAVGKNDSAEINHIVNTSLAIYSRLSLVILLITAVVSLSRPPFLKSAAELQLFRAVVPVLGVSIAVGFFLKVFRGILVSYLRYDLSSTASIAKLAAANTAVYFSLKAGGGVISLTLITFLTNLLEYALLFFFARKVFPGLRLGRQFFLRARVNTLFGYSATSLVAQIADLVRCRLDYLVIAWVLDMKSVAYYAVGMRLIDYFYQFVRNSVGLAKPIYSRYEGEGNYELIRERFCDMTRMSVMAAVFIGASLFFYGKPFILRWMGARFESSYYVALILTAGWTLELMQSPTSGLLYGLSKHHYFAVAHPIEAALNFGLSIWLAHYYGIYGVALGTAVPMIIFRLAVQPRFVCRTVGLNLREYYLNVIAVPAVKTLAPLAAYFFFMKGFLRPEYPPLLMIAAAQGVLFSVWAYFFILGKKVRIILKNSLAVTYA